MFGKATIINFISSLSTDQSSLIHVLSTIRASRDVTGAHIWIEWYCLCVTFKRHLELRPFRATHVWSIRRLATFFTHSFQRNYPERELLVPTFQVEGSGDEWFTFSILYEQCRGFSISGFTQHSDVNQKVALNKEVVSPSFEDKVVMGTRCFDYVIPLRTIGASLPNPLD